jgi:hypothetical protein
VDSLPQEQAGNQDHGDRLGAQGSARFDYSTNHVRASSPGIVKQKTEEELGIVAAAAAAFAAYWFFFRNKPSGTTPGGGSVANGQQHAPERTPLAAAQARAVMMNAWKEYFTKPPTIGQMAMILAHTALETGRWKKMYGNNWGFITTAGGLDYYILPDNPLKFRWYPSLDAGARDYLSFMYQHMNSAYELWDSDNPMAYVHELRKKHYFCGDEADCDRVEPGYVRAVTGLYNEFKIWLSTEVQGLPSWPAGWKLARLTPDIIAEAQVLLRTLSDGEYHVDIVPDGRTIRYVKGHDQHKRTVVTAWEPK